MTTGKKMGVGAVIGLVVLGLILAAGLVGGSLFMMYQSLHDTAITWENEIEKKYFESENVLSRVTLTIQETAGVTGMYADDLKDVIKGTYEGRYGDKGVQASMTWIKEQNHQLDPSLYLKLQNVIEGGRKEFEISQNRRNEVCQEYKKTREYLVRGFLLRMADFPKKDMTQLCVMVLDATTKKAFETGLQEPLIKQRQ